jgi:hypothetical protein
MPLELTAVTDVAINRRSFNGRKGRGSLYLSTSTLAVVCTGSDLWKSIDNVNPAAGVLALSTIMVELGPIELDQFNTVKWRGGPFVFIDHDTPIQATAARADDNADLSDQKARQRQSASAGVAGCNEGAERALAERSD